nr:MAG TPA: Neck appendage protein [Caudoviricetes sp.]
MIYLKEGQTPLNFAYNDEIVQEGNSKYQLSFKFPTNNPLWEELVEETLLLADDLHGEQEFIIFEVEKHHAYITVYANQVATLLNNYSITELSVNNASGDRVMRSLVSSIIREHPFTFSSDIANTHSLNLKNVTVANALFKDKHSIVGQWGGDLIRDKYDIRLLSNGGSNKEALFMYKKNLKSYQQKKSIKDLRTRIHFTKTINSQKEGEKDKVIAVTVDSPLIGKYKNIYEGNLDVSDQDVTDEATLRKYGENYFKTTLCDVIEENIEINVVGTPDEPVGIFDTVTIFHEKFNLDVKKKITKYTYSPMGRRLKTIGFGKIQSNLGTALASMVDNAVSEQVESRLDAFKIQKNLAQLLKLDRKGIEDKLIELEEKSKGALEVKKALFEADGTIPDVVKAKILDAVEGDIGRLKTIITEAELIKAIQAKLNYAEIKNALIDKAFINQIISDEKFTQQFEDGEVTTQNIFTKLKDSIKSNISKEFVTKEGVKKLVNDLTIDADGIRQITQQESSKVFEKKKAELKGVDSYIHKKYSDYPDGREMSDNSTLKYIGIYTGDKQQAPTNASEYSWTKIKSDGKLYKAYSNSLNGTDFTLVEPDENAKLLAKNRPRVNIVNDNDISDIWQANMFLSFKPNTKYTLTARAKGNSNKLWAYFRNNKTSEEYNWGQLEFRGLETKSITFTTTNDVEGVLFKFVLVPEDEDWTGIQIDWFTIYEGDKRYSDYPTNEPAQYHKYRYFGYVFKESTPVASDFEWFDLQQTSITNDKYTHIVYSDNADGSNFGREPKKYMGVARTTSPTQPTDKTAYKWFKMKGEDGERGRDGVDGKSINENLVPNSNFVKELENWEMPRLINSGLNYQKGHAIQHFGRGYHFWGTPNGNDKGLGTVPFNFIAKQGEKITLSMDLGKDALNNYSTLYLGIHYLGDDNSLKGQQWQELDLTAQNFEVKKYKRISRTFTVGSDMRKCRVMIHCKPQQPANFYIDNIKLERGDTATEWCPAYEDLQGRDGRNGDSYTRNYLSGTADEKILLAINDNFDIQEAFKLVDNKNFRDLGFKNGDKVTFIADYEVLTNGSNKKISKLNFEWHDDTKYRVWMSQDVNPTKGTYVRTLTMNNDLLDCKRARFRADNVNAKIKITNARVIQGDTVQPWSIAQEDLQAHSLTANLRFEGTYINNITNNVRPYLDVFYDGQKVSSGFNAQVKYKGGNRTDWSGFWNVNFDSNGRITNLDWGNREQNGTPLEVIVLVTYKDSNTIANARLDNLPDPTEIKEITKKYKTFESTIDRFNSTIGEVKQQVLANEEKRNLVLGSRMISESDYNKIGGSIDLTLQQAYEGLPYLSLQQNGKTSRVWQGVGFNLSINRINKGETYSIKIPIFINDTIRPDEGAYLEIKNHDTGEILWQSKLDKNTYPIGVWHTHEYTFTASKDMKISKNSFWIYIVKNGFLAFAKPYMCAGSSLPKNYSPAPEDVYLINERVESKILQIKNEINLAVEENIKRATIPTDNLYLSEYGGASDKYFETRENLKANEFYTFVFNANGTSETATGRIYKGINRIGESNFRISINNGLNAFLVKYPSERSKGEGINLDNIPNGVNISDVKIFKGNFLSYFKEDVTKAEIKILKNKIENAVTEGDFGTKLTQNANSLRLAWNNISEYVQFENGGLNIYNGEISEYQLRSRFDQDGNTFYRNGYTVGYIGTVALKDRSNDYGLTFNLEHNATYMAWAYRTKYNDNPDLIWYYTRKSISAYTEANTLNAGCDLNMQNNKLKNTQILNSSFSDSTATSTSLKFTDGQTVTSGWFVLPTSIDDDGNVRGWADKCFLAFRNGILVNYSLP